MLAKRIIPCLDIRDGLTVKGVNFTDLRSVGDPVELGARYAAEGADELVYLDISATAEGRRTFTGLVSRIAARIDIPFTVGGGIASVDDAGRLLDAGADKITVNSAAVADPSLIDAVAAKYGSQFVTVAIDARRIDGRWRVTTHGGRRLTDRELFAWAEEACRRGAGEILFTSMDHDGTRNGYPCDTFAQLSLLPVPVIASGGAGSVQHPRSVPGIIYGLTTHAGVPSELIEWHGHNDFYKAVNNSTTAWLYGASGVNCSLFGIGERTGNTPLEAMVFEYAQLKGTLDGMDTTVITELAEYFEKELGYVQPSRTPFVGSNFNVTRAGIHADGLLKNEEIYNIFDTGKFLNRPPLVSVSNTSGLAGIAHWINSYYHLPKEKWVDKNSDLVKKIKVWVDAQYEDGRVTVLTDSELVEEIGKCCKELNITI